MFSKTHVAVTCAAGMAIALSLAGTASARQNTPDLSLAAAHGSVLKSAPDVQPTWEPRGPSAAADKVGNQIYVYWASTSGELEEAYSDNGTSDWKSGPVPGMGTLYSQPSVATTYQDAGGHSWQYVFWEGGGAHQLWMAYWNGAWNGPYNLGYGSLGSQPTVSYDVTSTIGNVMVVSWTGTDGDLWYATSTTPYDTSSWPLSPTKATNTKGNPVGTLTGAPSASGTCNYGAGCTNDDVFWQGTDNTLWEASYIPDTNQWQPNQNPYTSTLGSEPSATADLDQESGDAAVLAWRGGGGDGNLWFWDYADPNASPQNLGMGDLGSAPAIAWNAPGGAVNSSEYFFWKGSTNNDLYEAYAVPGQNLQGPFNLGFGPIGGDPAT
jgi:hypothetical protein